MRVLPITKLSGELVYVEITKGVIVRGVACQTGDLVELPKREADQLIRGIKAAKVVDKKTFDAALAKEAKGDK